MVKTSAAPRHGAGPCGHPFDLVAVLEQKDADSIGQSATFSTPCAQCGQSFEIRLKIGGYDIGYSYFGGSMHFEPLATIQVPGLQVTPGEPDDLDIAIGARRWHFGVRQRRRERFVVLGQAFVAGKSVHQLDFARLHVELTGIERDHVRIAWDRDTVLCARDCLHLEGLAPALTKAWHYMNQGGV